jgi:hypothetical protein
MLLFSMILTWAMLKIIQTKPSSAQKDKIGLAWVTISAVSGLSLFNFGSSGELFYFPAIIIFAVWQRKKLPNLKYLIISLLVFTLTFVPLVLFDLKHGHILVHNFLTTFTVGKEGSFKLPNLEFIAKRNSTYLDIFINKIFPTIGKREFWMLIVIFLSSIPLFPALIKNKGIKLIMLLLISPIIGLYFYQGNYGILYDYYMTGYYLIFVLFFSIILAKIWKTQANQHPLVKISRKLLVIYFFYLFVINNIPLIWARYSDGCAGKESICLLNQKQAIEWISSDAKNMGNKDFNVDVYVPPVIPYAYDYLFKWKSNPHNVSNQVPLLYTLYEVDPPHPERLKAWLDRQEQIGKIEYTYKTGGITVERRTRITK